MQWNDQAADDYDVRLYKKRLVRFRLCPTDSCSRNDAGGCDSEYGDYIVDLETYLNAYYMSKWEAAEQECGQYIENYCSCQNNGDDGFNEAECQYQCIVDAEMSQCYQYMEDMMYQENFQIQQYMQCAQFQYNNNNNRKLEEEQQQAEYFVGPLCAEQGGAINLGMFSDDTCSTPIEDNTNGASTFKSMTGFELPYSEKSIVGADCLSCVQVDENQNDNNGNNQAQISEACQQTYMNAGKCESQLTGTVSYPNENACTYIEGIKVVREDGMVFYQQGHANAVTTAFIVIFAMAFVAIALYSWYLHTRLSGSKQSLLNS